MATIGESIDVDVPVGCAAEVERVRVRHGDRIGTGPGG